MASGASSSAGSQYGAGRGDRQVFAVGTPAAGDQPFTAAAADEGWLCVVRPGNIGCHGDDKGFGEHIFLRGVDVLMRETVRGRRETIVNRREIRCQICLRAPLHCCSAIIRNDTGDPDARLLAGGAWLRRSGRMSVANPAPRRTTAPACLMAASRFARVFELAAPDAPGLVCFGAEFDPAMADPMHAGSPAVGVSGVGLSLQEAFQGCIGEGIEYLSQLQTGTDVLESSGPGDPAAGQGPRDTGVPRRSRGVPPASGC